MDYVDASGNLVTGALNANLPTIAALHGLTTEELTDNLLQHQDLVFFDDVHPNAQANALLGAYMHALLTGTPWIETLPLTGADVDYPTDRRPSPRRARSTSWSSRWSPARPTRSRCSASVRSGTPGASPTRRCACSGPAAASSGSNADDGVGFDASLTFTAATSGNYTVEFLGTGAPTGSYAVQAAVVSGAAMNAGNTYTVNSASTVVLEGAGGVGQDVVKASVSYALSAGSEIEVLRTTNDRGKGAINLTGNEFGQTIIGNAGANVHRGQGGQRRADRRRSARTYSSSATPP